MRDRCLVERAVSELETKNDRFLVGNSLFRIVLLLKIDYNYAGKSEFRIKTHLGGLHGI